MLEYLKIGLINNNLLAIFISLQKKRQNKKNILRFMQLMLNQKKQCTNQSFKYSD